MDIVKTFQHGGCVLSFDCDEEMYIHRYDEDMYITFLERRDYSLLFHPVVHFFFMEISLRGGESGLPIAAPEVACRIYF